MWGKAKLARLLQLERRIRLLVSMVGRILKQLLKRQLIRPVAFYYGRTQRKRARAFHGHSQRYQRSMRAKQPGQMIQIDYMTVYPAPGVTVKHFKAVCPLTKLTVTQAYRRATSRIARSVH